MLGIAGATQGFGVVRVNGGVRTGVTVGAGAFRLKTAGTSAANTAATMSKRNPNNPSPGSTWSTAITSAGSPVVRQSISFSQVGGQVDWAVMHPDEAIAVLPGVTNKFELFSISNTATQGLDMTVVITEGSGA